MVYASSLRSITAAAEKEAGIEVKKKIEAGSAEDVTEEVVREAMEEMDGGEPTGTKESTAAKAFSRPKRPGKR